MKRYEPSEIRHMSDEQLHRLLNDILVPNYNKRTAREVLQQRQRQERAVQEQIQSDRDAVDDDRAARQTVAAEISAAEAQRANEIATKAEAKALWALGISILSAIISLLAWLVP